MSSLPRPPPSASILDAAVASPSLSTTILLALATALVLPLLLVALGASISALWKAIKAELAPVQAPAPRRKKSSKPPRATTAAAAEAPPPLPLAETQEASPPSLKPGVQRPAAAPVAAVHPAQAVMRALNDPTLQVRVSGLLTRNPPGGGALFRGELMDGSAVAVFAARRPMREVGGASTSSASASNGPSSRSTQSFSIPPLLGAGAAHPNVAQLFAVRETVVPGGCNAASGALLPPARRGCWGAGGGSVRGGAAVAGALSASSSSSDGSPLSLAAALAAAGAPLPDTCSSKTPPVPEIETVAIYEFCERGTLRDAIRAWAATAAAAKSRLGGGVGVGVGGACAAAQASSSSSSRLTPFDPSISPAPPPDDAHLRVKTLLEVARGLARVHRAGGRPHGALCAENVVLAASDADRRGFVAKLAAFSRPPSAGVGAGVGAWGAAPPGLAPELVEAARGGALGGAGAASTMSASELRRRRRLASTSSAEDIDEEVEFSAPLPPWAAPLGGGPEMSGRAASSSSSSSLAPPPPPPAATFEADVYAFGVLAWEVAASADAGLLPPPLPTATSSSAASSSARNAAEEEALLASWPCCRALGSLATQCLSPQPRARPSVAQLLRSLAALEERLRADTARSELDYLFAAVNARQAPVSSSSSSSALAATAPAFEPRVVRAAAPVAAAVAAAAAAATAPSSCGGTKGGGGGEIEGAEEEEGNGQVAAQSAPRPAAAAAASSSRPFTEDIFFGMPSPPM